MVIILAILHSLLMDGIPCYYSANRKQTFTTVQILKLSESVIQQATTCFTTELLMIFFFF